MTIVCGVDFSENAALAADAAGAIAKRWGMPLLLVHAVAPIGPLTPAAMHEGIRKASREWIEGRAAALAERFGIEVQGVAEQGNAADQVVAVAQDAGARLVVVSSLGAQKQHRWLLGSVAERVAQMSPVPVLVIRDTESIHAWIRNERSLRILVGVDLGETSRAALRWAAELRSLGRCELEVTQVAWPFGEHVRLGLPAPAPLGRLPLETHALLLRDLQAWVGDLPGEGETTLTVSPGPGRVDVHLAALAAQSNADLVVVGTHQRAGIARLWQTSVSRGVLHHAACSVACVPCRQTSIDDQAIPTFRQVLVPTDFSPVANRAIPVAYGLVATGGVVHLLHVVTRRPGEGDPDPGERLRSLVPQGAAARGVRTEIEIVMEEDAGAGIWHAAGRLGVDAICMATHGRSGVSRIVMGSQAQEVVQRSRHPVLLVPPERND